MTGRQLRIRALAWTLHDLLPQPVTATGAIVACSASPGEGPSERVECPECGGRGELLVRRRGVQETEPCVTCGGRPDERDERGRLVARARRGAGRVDRDQYTGRLVASADIPTVPAPTARCGCAWCQPSDGGTRRFTGGLPRGTGMRRGERCGFCGGSGWRVMSVEVAQDGPDDGVRSGVERMLDRRRRTGDWAALERALGALRRHCSWSYRVFVRVRVHGELLPGELDDMDRDRLLVADRLVEARMPREVRCPAWAVECYRRRLLVESGAATSGRRDELVLAAFRAGEPVRVLAERFGVSARTVQRIVARGDG